MFEKEAEEYREKEKDKGYYWVTQEMEQSELDTIVDESFKDGAEFGYNKANEWHYMKDGDLPPLRKEVLWCVDKQLWLGELLERRIDFGEWELDRILFNDYEIAWKEIVLPDLKGGK